MKRTLFFNVLWLGIFLAVAVAAHIILGYHPDWGPKLPGSVPFARLIGLLASVLAGMSLMSLATNIFFAYRGRPKSEASMVVKLYRIAAVLAMLFVFAFAWGQLRRFGEFVSLFGGMLLGWSLQAPVSGFAAFLLVSMKRPFRPGDRIQLPNLGLTGDVLDVGAMYVVLDQVGGTVGSEDAVGRHILVPNAMLFSQVVINFTVIQKAAYMLDEIVVRVTYDSDMNMAERIMLDAAKEVTKDIITATGVEPYIRSDLYDYGVYLRLRYQTAVQDRPKIAYEINKRILEGVQKAPRVDLAIPFIYSYRAGLDQKEADAQNAAQALSDRIEQGDAELVFRTRIARQVTFGKQRYRLALELHVIDNGPGVADSIKDRIFYPLVSGRDGGSGLGLTLAQTFVQQHHGLIECDSAPGKTDFKILIPLP